MSETEPPPALRLSTLGPLAATRGPTRLRLGGPQQRAVLAILLVRHPAPVSVARIADDIWGEHVPRGHVRTIHTYVHHLREALGGGDEADAASHDVIATVGGGYRLTVEDEALDAVVFERRTRSGQEAAEASRWPAALEHFEAALALWQGEPLSDLDHLPFVADYAHRLGEVRLTALAGRIEARLALGEHAAVVADLEELTTQHPLDERFHAQRILALYRCGRQGDALAAYRSAHQVLDDELGVRPGPRLRELQAAVLAQDPGLDLRRERREEPAVRPAPPRPARRPTLVLVGAAALVSLAAITLLGTRPPRSVALSTLPANSVAAVSADGTLSDAVTVAADPAAVAYSRGTLWVTGGVDDRVTRVDLGSHRVVDTVPVGHNPSAVAVRGSDVWVANSGDGTVSRVNTATNTVVQTVPVCAIPTAIATDRSGVWVACGGDDTVQRIDPRTGRTGTPLQVGGRPDGIAVGAGSVWVTNGDDRTVSRLDTRSGKAIGGPIPVGSGPSAVLVTAGAVWVADSDDQTVDRLDAHTGALVARIRVGDGPVGLAAADHRVWVGNAFDGTLAVIDPATNTLVRHVSTRASPRALAAVGTGVWVASGALADPAHRGGTLIVTDAGLPGQGVGIDPSNAYLAGATLHALRLVYDGLVAYRVGAGPLGMRVVPDLATAIPLPADGGRTYAFTVRKGVRFSDGSPVHASDIRRGVRRALMTRTYGGGPADTVGIVGAEHCADPHATCDLSRGVVVDDASGSIVFHLRARDPDFLLKLAYFGAATPSSAPATETSRPLPGTGPYRISQYRRGEAFVLTRNRYFRQWSFAAQPDGYVDQIRWVKASDDVRRLASTVAGRADVATIHAGTIDLSSQSAVQDFARSHPAQLHTENPFALDFFYLNPHLRPFNDVRVRRALNLAINRFTLVHIAGGPIRALPACQVLPPNFPGHRRHCPFSTGRDTAPYAGPDLPRARRLVAASGTRGMRVVVTTIDGDTTGKEAHYLVTVLRSLGFHASARLLDAAAYFPALGDPRARVQMIRSPGWLADYPAASDYYFGLFDCPAPPANDGLYIDRWCSPALDRMARRAYAAEGADPGRARVEWQEVDRRLTDSATVVPLVNTLESTAVSARVGDFQSSPFEGPLLSQLWVR